MKPSLLVGDGVITYVPFEFGTRDRHRTARTGEIAEIEKR